MKDTNIMLNEKKIFQISHHKDLQPTHPSLEILQNFHKKSYLKNREKTCIK
jgi:hypothetical protein